MIVNAFIKACSKEGKLPDWQQRKGFKHKDHATSIED
jgi:hypothetical protein